jgi:hypothetical protein
MIYYLPVGFLAVALFGGPVEGKFYGGGVSGSFVSTSVSFLDDVRMVRRRGCLINLSHLCCVLCNKNYIETN